MSRSKVRGAAVLIAGLLIGGLVAGLPATAAKKPLTKKKALKLFYTKAQSDTRYLNQGQGDTLYLSQTEGDARYAFLSVTDRGASSETGTTAATTTNTVTLNVPVNGVFLIAGSVSINSTHGNSDEFALSYRVDSGGFVSAAETDVAADAGTPDEAQLAFTDAVQVTAGAHDVQMRVNTDGGTTTYTYNLNNLSVTFIPQGTIT